MKFLLYCSEWLSGLKFNYHKSEMVAFGMDREAKLKIANKVNCQVGSIPMKYLGFPMARGHSRV
jgi:hypothetical protein